MLLELALVAAMQDSTTTCQTLFGQTTCQTTQQYTPPPVIQPNPYAFENARRAAEERGAESAEAFGVMVQRRRENEARAAEAAEAQLQAQIAADMRRAVVARIQRGDCPGAVSLALNSGDLVLARETREYCAAPSGSSTPSR